MEDSVTEGEGAVYFVFVDDSIPYEAWHELRGPYTKEEMAQTYGPTGVDLRGDRGHAEKVIRGVDVSEEFGV